MAEKIGDYLEVIRLHAVTAKAPLADRPERSVINCALEATSPVKVLYMASLLLDGMDLIDTFRVTVEPGENNITLPQMYVFNPICSGEEDDFGVYNVTLRIYASGGREYDFTAPVRFSK